MCECKYETGRFDFIFVFVDFSKFFICKVYFWFRRTFLFIGIWQSSFVLIPELRKCVRPSTEYVFMFSRNVTIQINFYCCIVELSSICLFVEWWSIVWSMVYGFAQFLQRYTIWPIRQSQQSRKPLIKYKLNLSNQTVDTFSAMKFSGACECVLWMWVCAMWYITYYVSNDCTERHYPFAWVQSIGRFAKFDYYLSLILCHIDCYGHFNIINL